MTALSWRRVVAVWALQVTWNALAAVVLALSYVDQSAAFDGLTIRQGSAGTIALLGGVALVVGLVAGILVATATTVSLAIVNARLASHGIVRVVVVTTGVLASLLASFALVWPVLTANPFVCAVVAALGVAALNVLVTRGSSSVALDADMVASETEIDTVVSTSSDEAPRG